MAGEAPWVALVGPEIEDNLGLRYVSSALQAAGLETEILPFNSSEAIPGLLRCLTAVRPAPVAVAVSLAFQARALDGLALITGLRRQGYAGHITAGGHFAAFAHEELLRDFPEVDSICCYEAEETMVALAEAVIRGRSLAGVPALAWRDGAGQVRRTPATQLEDLSRLPWPDRRGERASCLGYPVAPLIASRGCYGSCAFCCIAAWHRQASSRRWRERPSEDLAAEMAWLYHRQGARVFIFHDDDFIGPDRRDNLRRCHGLADSLGAHGVGPIALSVKARANDIDRELFAVLKDRLGCVRVFLGIETDSEQGLRTLRRGVRSRDNHRALAVLEELAIYGCFNMLIFDPDTTVASLQQNISFIRQHAAHPLNFGRVLLYGGTPLLARMQAEGRCQGDYLGHDYEITDRAAQRVSELALSCFRPRNFAAGAMANRLQGTRLDVEICRHLRPDRFRPRWLERSVELSRRLATDSADGLTEIVEHVEHHGPSAPASPLVEELSRRLGRTDRDLRDAALALEEEIQQAVGARCQHAKPVRLSSRFAGIVEGATALGRRSRA